MGGVLMRAVSIVLALASTGCGIVGPGRGGADGARRGDTLEIFDLAAGDLVITEIMKDPLSATSDALGEWFEVRNDAALEVDLNGLVLADNLGTYTVGVELIVPAGGYVVFGRSGDTVNNGGVTVDHVYGSALSLSNGADEVTLSYPTGSVVFDTVVYDGGATFPDLEGHSLNLEPTASDATSNNTGSNWCDAWDTTYGAGDYGSPGAANDSCLAKDLDGDGEVDEAFGGTDCNDNDSGIFQAATEIPGNGIDENCDGYLTAAGTDDLAAGDLVITEILQNPLGVPDGEGEWFEVLNNSGADVDLFGLIVRDAGSDTFTVTSNLVVADGAYVVFGVEDDTAQNGNAPVDWDWSNMVLENSSDEVILEGDGGLIIDEVAWDNGVTFPDPEGASMQLEPTLQNATDNDAGLNWCEAYQAWSGGDSGSPGVANPTCQDKDGDGSIDENAPWNGDDCDDLDPNANPGGTEIDNNGIDEDCDGLDASQGLSGLPAGTLVITEIHNHPSVGTQGEWFEVLNTGAVDVDVLGLEVTDAVSDSFTVSTSTVIEAGEYFVFGRNDDTAVNGDAPIDFDYPATFLLSDVADQVILSFGGSEIDRVDYDSVDYPDVPGAALSLEPTATSASDNDDSENWCDAYVAFGDGDFGTPGTINSVCIGRDVDMDGFADAAFGGTDCDDKDSGINPSITEVIGNDIDENCDGIDAELGIEDLDRGDLLITEIMKDPDEVSDGVGEWFEVANLTTQSIDLIGLSIEDDDSDQTELDTFVVIDPGGRVVLAREDDIGTNGGAPADYDYDQWSLVNGADEILLVRPSDGRVFDEVRYDNGTTFPDPRGSSFQLSSDIDDPDDNDLGQNWCISRDAFGDGDYGTPRAANVSCDWSFDFDFDFVYMGSGGLPDVSASTSISMLRDGTFTTGNLGEGTWSMAGTSSGQTITWSYLGTSVRYNGSRAEGGGCFSGVMTNTGDYDGTWAQTTSCP